MTKSCPNLTDGLIAELVEMGGPGTHPDGVIQGLQLRIGKTGRATWSLRYSLQDRTRRLPIGHWPAVRTRMARARARKALAEVDEARIGRRGDPSVERRAASYRVEDLIERYLQHRVRGQMKTAKEIERSLRADVIPAIGYLPVVRLEAPDVMDLVERVAQRAPVIANRVLQRLRSALEYGVERGIIHRNVAQGLRRPTRERPRLRVLSMAETRGLYEALREAETAAADAILTMMLTFARKGQVLKMRWDHLEGDQWHVDPESTKAGRRDIIHLVPTLLEMIERRRRRALRLQSTTRPSHPRPDEEPWVFASHCAYQPVSDLRPAKKRASETAGVTEWRLHDLRRGVTHLAEHCVAPHIIEALLHHKPQGVTRTVYSHALHLPERRRALELWEELVTGRRREQGRVLGWRGRGG